VSQTILNQCISLIETQKYAEAKSLLLALIDREPGNARAHYILSGIYITETRHSLAEQHLRLASKVATKQSIVFSSLAQVLNIQGQNEAALPYARKAVSLDSRSEFAHRILGEIYSDLRRPVLARQSLQNAISANPNAHLPHVALHELEVTLGNKAASEQHLADAQKIAPKDPTVLIALANSSLGDDPDVLENIQQQLSLKEAPISPLERSKLSFAAGKLLEKQGNLPQAFHYYDRDRAGLYPPFDLEKRKQQVKALKAVFTKDFFSERREFALACEQPVFIFGMPRSGTTLAEQIIARHPQASGIGEDAYLANELYALSQGHGVTPQFLQHIQQLDKRSFQRIGRAYLARLQSFDKKARRTVDKMPHNFERLWLLALLFPNAAFIHMERSSADTCASVYTTPLDPFHNYNIDQKSLGTYYGLYRELMDHWQDTLPVEIRNQSYEKLTTDHEGEARALVEHAKLEWNPVCLEHTEGDRQIFTFSKLQARQAVYTSSVGRWKKYEPHIQPLLEALDQNKAIQDRR
jgi:tetratricopeptide (TPR) repeat protein